MKSILYSVSDDIFKNVVANHTSCKSILEYFGLVSRGGNYKTFNKRIKELNIDTSHFIDGPNQSAIKKKTTKESFIKKLHPNSKYNREQLKKNLIKFGLLTYQCSHCGNTGHHNGKSLVLQIDHINGIGDDNRLENLQFLCPNCHSQTDNFAGKNLNKKNKKYFCKCGKKILKSSKECISCSKQKISWPSKEDLEKLVWEKPTQQISLDLGISDTAIAKKCKKLGIKKPPRGYWAKINAKNL